MCVTRGLFRSQHSALSILTQLSPLPPANTFVDYDENQFDDTDDDHDDDYHGNDGSTSDEDNVGSEGANWSRRRRWRRRQRALALLHYQRSAAVAEAVARSDRLLSLVRYPLMPAEFLAAHVESHPRMCSTATGAAPYTACAA